MVMKVCSIGNIYFRGKTETSQKTPQTTYSQQAELSNVVPDFRINTPQKYSKLGCETLPNGLKLYSYKLANGHRVSIVPMQGSPAVVKNYVNVGSMNETSDIKGISHFLEHMAFNGTNGENGHEKLEVGDSFKKIDELGGWANASTNYAITDYVNSSPMLDDKDLETQIKIIAAMTEDLELSKKMIEKEKKPVCSEINMILDNPKTVALDQTVRTLFDIKNPADEMVGGSVKHIKNLTQQDVKDYYNKYYTPDNMNLVITGDVNPDEVMKIVAKSFNSKKMPQGKKFEERMTPINKTVRKDFVNDKATSTEIVLGFAGPKNNDAKGRVIYDAVRELLLSNSGKLREAVKQYNSSCYIDSEKITTNPNGNRLVYLASTTSESNSEKMLQEIFNSIQPKKPTQKELNRIKESLLIERDKNLEYSSEVNDYTGRAVLDANLNYLTDYDKLVNSLTQEDIENGIKEYFSTDKAAVTLVHPKKDNNVSFKGAHKKLPINTDNLSEYKTKNNYNLGFYKTKGNLADYNVILVTNNPYHKKAGVIEVLNGVLGIEYDNKYGKSLEENNINWGAYAKPDSLEFFANGSLKNLNTLHSTVDKMIKNPIIREDSIEIAKERIRDSIERQQSTASGLYYDEDAKNTPDSFSDKEILDNLDSITVDDVKECYNYLLKNSRGIVSTNLPESAEENVKRETLKAVNRLPLALDEPRKVLEVYKPNEKAKVLTKPSNNSQADIMQVFKFKCDNSIKETAAVQVLNSILTSSSIGLFNVLREKEHLAYSVYSSILKHGDCGTVSCNILTTTDNKDIGEYSYENVQKSINGFNRQIEALKSGEFTDKDLANAKLAIKATLLDNEGINAKVGTITNALCKGKPINYDNELYKAIDALTREDIIEFAKRAFANKPTYSIVASEDTLKNNKEFLDSLAV